MRLVRGFHCVPPKIWWNPDPQHLKRDLICSRVFMEVIKLT